MHLISSPYNMLFSTHLTCMNVFSAMVMFIFCGRSMPAEFSFSNHPSPSLTWTNVFVDLLNIE